MLRYLKQDLIFIFNLLVRICKKVGQSSTVTLSNKNEEIYVVEMCFFVFRFSCSKNKCELYFCVHLRLRRLMVLADLIVNVSPLLCRAGRQRVIECDRSC